MRSMTTAAFFVLLLSGCAAYQPAPATSIVSPPLPEPTSADKLPTPDPYRRPMLDVKAPASWAETSSLEAARNACIVLVHESGKAKIAVMLRNTDDVALADHAERMIGSMTGGNVTTSLIMTTAGGDRAWFSWARHPTELRPVGTQGKVVLVRFPTMPERMAVISGIWPPAMNAAMVTDLDKIALIVILR